MKIHLDRTDYVTAAAWRRMCWAQAWYRLKIALRGCTYDVSILREYERLECARREREHD
jgi:hypothetical protein